MPQILDHFVEPLYGQVCLSDRDADLPWRDAISGQQVLANESAVVISVADQEAERPVELEVYLGDDEAPQLRDLQPVFSGSLNLSNPGLLVFTPTGEEVLLPEIREGPHQVTIYRNGYPTSRLVVLVDGRSNSLRRSIVNKAADWLSMRCA